MSKIRLDFLNWRPDEQDEKNTGLTVANGLVHDTEGYRPLHFGAGGDFVTTGGLGASVATISSVVARPVGPGGDLFCAWISGNALHVGLNGVTAPTAVTGYPLSFSTTSSSREITVFDVTEYAGKIFFVVEAAQLQTAPATTVSISHLGYMDF